MQSHPPRAWAASSLQPMIVGAAPPTPPMQPMRVRLLRRAAAVGVDRMVLVVVACWALAEAMGLGGSQPLDRLSAAAIAVSALVSSIGGFAFSAIAGSALAHLSMDPAQAVATMAWCSIAIQGLAVWQLRESIRWRAMMSLLVAGAATVPLGVWLLLHVELRTYLAALGVLLVGYGASLLWLRQTRTMRGGRWRAAAAGALGGITGGLAALPGPLVTIWCSMRGWDKLRQRATYQPYILVMQLLALAWLAWLAPERSTAAADTGLVPFAMLGALAGMAIFKRLSGGQFRVALGLLLALSGAGLLARAV